MKEQEVKTREEVQPGRTEEKPGEAIQAFKSDKGDQGGHEHELAIRDRIFTLTEVETNSQPGEDTGRPGEAFIDIGGGQFTQFSLLSLSIQFLPILPSFTYLDLSSQ